MDTIELIRIAQSGDEKAREEVILGNMALVWSIVKRFSGRGYEADDLFQIGCIGLMKAVDKFDLNYDVKFSTYAVPMIIGEIKRFLRDDGLLKVSRSIKENNAKIKQAKEEFIQKNNREPKLSELAEITGMAQEDIITAAPAAVPVESIYSTVYQGDGEDIHVIDRLSISGETDKLVDRMLLVKLISELAENERNLIRMRYYEDKTQKVVADAMGISQVQVSRMEKKILQKMRKHAACE